MSVIKKDPKNSIASNGKAPIGPSGDVVEAYFGTGKRYDPERDVMMFFPSMLAGVIRTLSERAIPRLEEVFEENEGLDQKMYEAILSLQETIKKTFPSDVVSYDEFFKEWVEANDKQAIDLLYLVFGRAIIQFYLECIVVRKLPTDERWPEGLDFVIPNLCKDKDIEFGNPSWKRLFRMLWRKLIHIPKSLFS